MKTRRKILYTAVAALLGTGVQTPAQAAGFAIIEHSVSGLGQAFAGSAAVAEDSSTIFFNPAGMNNVATKVGETKITAGAHIIHPSSEFEDDGSTHALQPLTGVPLMGNDGGDAGVTALVPNFYMTHRIDERLTFGFGSNAPFGLSTDYKEGWVGRYHGLLSEMLTVNLNPSLSYQVDDTLSVGVGVSAQYVEAKLTNAIDWGTLCFGVSDPNTCGLLGLAPQQNDGRAKIEGDDWSLGFNAGLLWQAAPNTRVGVAYRSKIDHELDGEAEFRTPANAALIAAAAGIVDADAHAKVTMPASFSVSAHHQLNSRVALLGDVTWTDWSQFEELRVELETHAADSVTTQNWDDSMRYSAGMIYDADGPWTYRAGLAWDETPIPDAEHRTPRIPGNDRAWVTLGASYAGAGGMSFDVSYAYITADEAKIRKLPIGEDALRGGLNGTYDATVHILSAQMSMPW